MADDHWLQPVFMFLLSFLILNSWSDDTGSGRQGLISVVRMNLRAEGLF